MEQLYVLELTNKKYYIGKTTDVIRRYEEHKSGKGSAWTSKYKPLSLIESKPIQNLCLELGHLVNLLHRRHLLFVR